MGEARRRMQAGLPRKAVEKNRVDPGGKKPLKVRWGMTTEKQRAFWERLSMMIGVHFPDAKGVSEDEDLSCEQCIDYAAKVCGGLGLRGKDVILRCMSKQLGEEIFINPDLA